MIYDVIILGSGPAGLTAGLYAGRAGKKTAIVTGNTIGGAITLTESIENYSGLAAIDGFSLTLTMKNQAERFGAEFFDGEAVNLQLDQKLKTVTLDSGTSLQGHNVILAMGTQKRKMGIPNEDDLVGQGVSYCATCDGNFFKGKSVAVYGGGDTALTDALYLARVAKKVTIIHRRDKFRATNALIEKLKNYKNIELVMDSIITELQGQPLERLVIKNVITQGVSLLDVDGLFVAIGTLPNTSLINGQIELDKSGYILTDSHMKTSLDGVYAAGDIRNTPLRQVITACADGAIAGEECALHLD